MDMLTWRQFVVQTEKQMKEKGISLDTEIGVIDFSYPYANNPPAPFIQDGLSLWMFDG